MIYLLDSNVYIEAQNRYYRMKICPGFWDWLDNCFLSGELASVQLVLDELLKKGDDLSDWAKARKAYFFEADDNETQAVFADIAQYVVEHPNYSEPNQSKFLGVADPLLIAKAKTAGATVVTHEVLVPEGSAKIKIPNICAQFGVQYCNTFDLLESLETQFILASGRTDTKTVA